MTTILFDGKNLHADRARLITCMPSRTTLNTIKLFRSPDNQIAIGCCGAIPKPGRERDGVFRFSREVLTKIHSGEMDDRWDISMFNHKKYGPCDLTEMLFIGMTSTHAFRLDAGKLTVQTGEPTWGGSGGRYAFSAYFVTRDAVASMRVAFACDPLSGGPIDSIPADTLEPFSVG